MRKPVYAICEQQRHRSAQSDQHLCCSLPGIPLLAIAEILRPQLASVAEQAGLRLTRSPTPKTGFFVTRLIYWTLGTKHLEANIVDACMKEKINRDYMGRVKRICVFEHSVMTNFNCACPAIQRGQGSGFLSEGSS